MITLTIIACVIIIVTGNLSYKIGKKHGTTAMQNIDNVGNSNIYQSGSDIDIANKVVLVEGNIVHAVTSSEIKRQHEIIEAELARKIGLECMMEGLIRYSYKENDWTSPTHITYDKVTATISVKE